jgi:hypothetical protein
MKAHILGGVVVLGPEEVGEKAPKLLQVRDQMVRGRNGWDGGARF